MNEGDALQSLRPGASWMWVGEGYSGLQWLDLVQTKPTEQEIIDEVARLQAVQELEEQRQASFKDDPSRAGFLDTLKTSTPAQISSWVDANVTDLAGARTVLKAIIKVIALDERS